MSVGCSDLFSEGPNVTLRSLALCNFSYDLSMTEWHIEAGFPGESIKNWICQNFFLQSLVET